MRTLELGNSGLQVTDVCLGSMTWGQQNTLDQAFEQLDYAINERGINFVDTAEMYSVPPSKDTAGKTETYIGHWLAANPDKREKLVLASKITGPGISWIRNGANITADAILPSIERSLKRLQTDYIDLYQLHWSNRTTPHFSRHWPGAVDPATNNIAQLSDEMLGILEALDEAIKAGKIRACGLSNETPWGVSEYQRLAEQNNLPQMASVQNEFNLLHLKDWPYLLETCAHTNTAFMPWSPLAGGALTGKYANGIRPAGARWTMAQRNGIFRDTPNVHEAVAAYQTVAEKHNLSLPQMCLAWVRQCPGVSSTIIGATSLTQLKENIDAFELTLSEHALNDIHAVVKQYPQPF